MTIGLVQPARLEDWLRDRYFSARIDISSSGVENYSLGDLEDLLGIDPAELARVRFRDSPSVGGEPLRAAIAARFAPSRHDDVMVTHGASEALFLAISAIVRRGDNVVVMEPAYQSLSSIADALGARLTLWELRETDGFQPDLSRLYRLVAADTKLLIVNFPHNPTGVTLDNRSYADLLGLVEERSCYLLWDGSFSELVYEDGPLPDPSQLSHRCISVGTLSKAYGLPGLRVGWCIAPQEVRAAMIRLRDYLTIANSPLAELLATAVLCNADAVLGPRLAQAATNRKILTAWAQDNGLTCPPPKGGVSAFPSIPGIEDVESACIELSDRHEVLVVPGSCFGHPGRMRIGFGGPTAELVLGLRVVGEVVARLRHDMLVDVASYRPEERCTSSE